MTREEYINFANCLKNNYTIDFDVLPEFCDMAISAVKWIPITERLPEVSQNVLATTRWGEVTIAERLNFDPECWFVHEGSTNAHTEDIIAWMPLPEPYKGGDV